MSKIAEGIKTENQLLLERTKPLTAEETLRRESFFRLKLEAFYSALEVVYRKYASDEFFIRDKNDRLKPASNARPSESEINLAYGRMAMYASDRAVLDKYQHIHSIRSEPGDIGDLVALMRKDLGFSEGVVSGATYPYIFGPERQKP